MITENTKIEDLRKHKFKNLVSYFIYNQVEIAPGILKRCYMSEKR